MTCDSSILICAVNAVTSVVPESWYRTNDCFGVFIKVQLKGISSYILKGCKGFN